MKVKEANEALQESGTEVTDKSIFNFDNCFCIKFIDDRALILSEFKRLRLHSFVV